MSDNSNSWAGAVLLLLGLGLSAAAITAFSSGSSTKGSPGNASRRGTRPTSPGEPEPVDADPDRLSRPIPEKDQLNPDAEYEGDTTEGWLGWY